MQKWVPAATGLSPRVRGNLRSRGYDRPQSRSIPACAGEPPAAPPVTPLCEVYPRVCGGTLGGITYPLNRKGLSPRVRGNPPTATGTTTVTGSIPACAGEPECVWTWTRRYPVYPRVCGGTFLNVSVISQECGLSPRVRGNLAELEAHIRQLGSIPACAGEPGDRHAGPGAMQVYPRVCGGTTLPLILVEGEHGLSPRVRGNQSDGRPPAGCKRSIPACAGEPDASCEIQTIASVYPRVCGGTAVLLRRYERALGLSPRVRGNRSFPPSAQLKTRSIPACAGEPIPD